MFYQFSSLMSMAAIRSGDCFELTICLGARATTELTERVEVIHIIHDFIITRIGLTRCTCLLYTSPSPRDVEESRMPSSA